MKYIIALSLITLTLTSCGTMNFFETSDFTKINSINDLEGYYLNKSEEEMNSGLAFVFSPVKYYSGSLLSCFLIRDTTDVIYITAEKTNEIKLIYYSDTIKHEQIFKGKMKKKYFEIYHRKKQFFIPLIFSHVDNCRIRIGKSKDGKLLIRDYYEQSGNWLFIASGHASEKPYKFPLLNVD